MKLIISFIVVCAAVYANANQETASGDGTLGNDPKALQAKFDLIDRKLLELQVELKNQREEVARNFSLLQDCVTPTAPSTQITSTTPNPKGPRSCKEVASNVSGVHLIYVDNNDAPFQVYCEMEKNGGGWLVVQHRFNGSVDFYRTWDEYREGFGDLNGEFWLGLEKMHQITASRNHELIVELKDFNNKNKKARYYGFQIGSESEGYKLKTLGDYRGDAGDTMKCAGPQFRIDQQSTCSPKMKLTIGFIVVCAALYAGTANKCPEQIADAIVETPPGDGILGQVLEVLLARFDFIDRKLLELQVEVTEHREESERNRFFNDKTFADLIWTIYRLEQDVGRNFSVLQDHSLIILDQQKSCANHDRLREKLLDYRPKQNNSSYDPLKRILLSFKSRIPDCVTPSTLPPSEIESTAATTVTESTTTFKPKQPASCKEVTSNVSGVHFIHVDNNSDPFQVYCEMEKHGGGWLVVQHRFNGSVDFYRTWDEYREGFGDLNGEFWLGLEKMHQITASRNHELMVEIRDFSGDYGYARYNGFQIGSESEAYKLKTLGDYSGTAGDSMTETNKGMKFSTKDRDNDESRYSCAQDRQGAWWYEHCSNTNLNGVYQNNIGYETMNWHHFKNDYNGLRFSRMMIREL
ncbi:fibrinogen beta chain-like [Anopheles aquasalis]|uniref:fibrinogen beta chain-like n=1 Tax=Anopheles aquasalis TaxID=42839 RepID=UPI00215B1E61|nr:fibrinogen beta chain-like [Anopheles aquasalis]